MRAEIKSRITAEIKSKLKMKVAKSMNDCDMSNAHSIKFTKIMSRAKAYKA